MTKGNLAIVFNKLSFTIDSSEIRQTSVSQDASTRIELLSGLYPPKLRVECEEIEKLRCILTKCEVITYCECKLL